MAFRAPQLEVAMLRSMTLKPIDFTPAAALPGASL